MPNENTYRDCSCKSGEIPHNADYVHNSSTPIHCCDNDKCECHHPLRLWAIKYEVVGVPKFSGVAVVQAKDLCNAQYVFIQNSKFNGFREYIHILCIEELYPNPEPILLLEDSAAIINRRDLKSYPFLLKSDYEHNIQNISDNVIEAVEDYIEHNPIQQVQSNWKETDETSQAYILNKPEIPDAQVQADWNETNESSKAFIQNKPTIPEQVQANWSETDTTSKSYIQNKPVIPAAQVQANWGESDTTSKAYILNKPTIPEQIQANWNETNSTSKAFIQNKPKIPAEQVNADWESESGKSQILNKPTDLVRKSDIEGLLKNDGTVYTGKYLEQVDDLDNFQASEGKIVQYIGETNSKYTNGFNYKKVGVRMVIQPGTRYIEINDSTGELLKVGVPNGRYYNIDEYEEIIWHTWDLGSPTIGVIPDKSDERGFNMVTNIGNYAIINNKFLKITSVRNLEDNGYLKVGNTYGSGRNSIIGFEDGTEIELGNRGTGDESIIIQNELSVYENQDGVRIYQLYPLYSGSVLITENWGNAKRAISFSTFIINNTTEEVIIDTTEWQQCIPPEEDTSHYVTDSEIGWIEH